MGDRSEMKALERRVCREKRLEVKVLSWMMTRMISEGYQEKVAVC